MTICDITLSTIIQFTVHLLLSPLLLYVSDIQSTDSAVSVHVKTGRSCEQEEVADAEAAGPSTGEGAVKAGERRPRQQDRPKSHVADMLGAMAALQQQER